MGHEDPKIRRHEGFATKARRHEELLGKFNGSSRFSVFVAQDDLRAFVSSWPKMIFVLSCLRGPDLRVFVASDLGVLIANHRRVLVADRGAVWQTTTVR